MAFCKGKETGNTTLKRKYLSAIKLSLKNLVLLQFNGTNSYYLGHPERVVGGLRYNIADNRIRIDTTAYYLDGLSVILRDNILGE